MATRSRRKYGSWCIYPPNLEVNSSCTTNADNSCLVEESSAKVITKRQTRDTTSLSKQDKGDNDFSINGTQRSPSSQGLVTTQQSLPSGDSRLHSSEPQQNQQLRRTPAVIADRLKRRTLSATEFKTRLMCPKGLLITTEAPKAGEFYRRRSNTDVTLHRAQKQLGKSHARNIQADISPSHGDVVEKNSEGNKEILLEFEAMRSHCDDLEKENERLHEELENRNQVIDHLIDYMKSLVSQGFQPTEDVLSKPSSTSCNNDNSSSSFTNI